MLGYPAANIRAIYLFMNAVKIIRTVGKTLAEFALHLASTLAIVGILPFSLDSRLAVALLHFVAFIFASNFWPILAQRYLLISTGALATAYGILVYLKGPVPVLSRTFGLAN